MGIMDPVKVYAPDEVSASFGGVIFESGLGKDEFLRITPEGPNTTDVAGVDGEVTVARTKDKRANFYVTLQQTSRHNDELSIYANLAKNAPGMTGAIHPFIIKDPNGRAVYTAQNCWVQEEPEVSFNREPGERVWGIRIAHLMRNDGGN